MSPSTFPAEPVTLYRMALSGHCHRVQLFASLIGLPLTMVDVDVMQGEHRKPPFIALNPFGQVPVIQDGDVTLADSNAILVYLEARFAPGQWLPRDPLGAAAVQRWLSVAAGPVAFGPAAARVIELFKKPVPAEECISRAVALFGVMEAELARTPFLAGSMPTLADVANYAYIAHAPEGNVSLAPYPKLREWLARIEALPGFVPMARSAVGLAA
ncbi:glutathione S-transferase [soil metagenome]